MLSGKKYTLTFYAGAFVADTYPFAVGIFGHANCNAVPFGEQGRGNGCPTNHDGWVLLGKSNKIDVNGAWVPVKIDLTIP